MNIGNTIKIRKASMRRVFTPKESSFLFSAINISKSMSSAHDILEAWAKGGNSKKQIIPGFMLDEHKTISYSILSKVENEIITAEDLEEINR